MNPRILETNKYRDDELERMAIFYSRMAQDLGFHVDLYYMLACYEIWYPFFKYREHAEEGFETVVYQACQEGNLVPLSQIIGIILIDMDNFKKHRNFE